MSAVLFLLASLLFQLVTSEVVSCPDQQSYCNCSTTASVCEFTLRIEYRHTFTSYKLFGSNNQQSFDGEGYFLNRSGYIPTVQQDGDCNFDDPRTRPFTSSDFTRRGCSVPMTVDGVNYRAIITINGQIPGPTLVVASGQTVHIHVVNSLVSQSVSIHWHGLFQKDTPWMDGVGFVSHPPIDPGSSFDYIFTAGQSGTYWYHSHVGSERADGLFGGLVLRDPDNFFEQVVRPQILPEDTSSILVDAPELHTITVIDWMREHPSDMFVKMNDSLFFFPDAPVSTVPDRSNTPHEESDLIDGTGTSAVPYWSGLINGRGRFDSNTLAPLSVFSVESNCYYRFRLVGSNAMLAFNFSIDGHTLRAIASDGSYYQPRDVEYIVVHSGERYDFILNTTNPNRGQTNFWIRAETLVDTSPRQSVLAVLSYTNGNDLDWRNGYSNIPDARPTCTSASPCRVLNCPFQQYPAGSALTCISLMNLSSLFPPPTNKLPKFPPSSSCPDCIHFLNFGFDGPRDDSFINGKSLQLPNTAYATNCAQYTSSKSISNTCDRCTVNTTSGCRCIHVIPIANAATFDPNSDEHESIIMIFSSLNSPDTHPIHLHGHNFQILYTGYGTYDSNGKVTSPSTDLVCDTVGNNICVTPKWANGTPPSGLMARVSNGRVVGSAISKDTVMVPGYGYVVIALQADNPGYWFLHCHIEFHQALGMAAIIQEYDPLQHKAPPPNINNHGSFQWSVEEFKQFQDDGLTCAD
ncbi:PREDICTED: laccase-like, partial [Amphimedon queenslandica]|uniref:Uncharacterized protein n=2 Tax=Amphimedon queenslandica TaxID=400682 RepID=A0AAN0IJA7_AMPQE